MNNRFLTAAAFIFSLIALPAFADLHSARAAGQIGEKADGFVVALDPSVQALADQVNAKRQAEYAAVAAKKGQSVAVVGSVFASTIIAGLEKGAKYQAADGSWKTK
ncbi:MAG: DUF1318 domain-containing protein [Alphaproteobacteria bacterium]|nr:DUF1318 domain-containing protein [Alphaproteobacteria bacterium]